MPAPSDLVHETTTSTGTGNLTLASEFGKRTFNTAFGTGGSNVFDYFISHLTAAEWERGTGSLSAATTLVRNTVADGSAGVGAAVDFSAGTKDVTNDIPAASQIVNPMTTRGDIIYRNATTAARLAVGSSGKVLQSDGTDPAWTELATPAQILAGTANKVIAADDLVTAMAGVALSDGANIATDLATGVYFTVTLAGNRTLDNPTNHVVGRTIYYRVTQDGTGSRTLSYGSQFDFGQESAPTLSTAASTVDLLAFFVESTSKMVYLGIRQGV